MLFSIRNRFCLILLQTRLKNLFAKNNHNEYFANMNLEINLCWIKCNFITKVNLGSKRKYGTPNMHIAIIGTEKVANMLTFSCQSFLEKKCHTFLKEDFYKQKIQTKIHNLCSSLDFKRLTKCL